jgi:hypothetical protein
MKTAELIDLLAKDDTRDGSGPCALSGAIATGFLVALTLTAAFLGLRPAPLLLGSDVLAKLALTMSLALLVLPALLRTLRPNAMLGWRPLFPLLAAAAVIVAAVVEIRQAPETAIWRRDTPFCLVLIPLFSLPGLYAIAWAARLQAPTDLPRAGFFAGLAAGAVAASAYALHCPNDDPVYLAAWYLPAVLISGLVGRILGPRLLAW